MDIRQHAFPGDAEGFRKSEGGMGGFPAGPASLPDGEEHEDGYRMESRHQRGAPTESDSQSVRRMRHDHCGHRCLPRGGNAVPPPLPLPRMQAALSPPLDLVTDG